MGIYPLTWVFQSLYHTLPLDERKPPRVVSSISKFALTGADENTSMILTFPKAPGETKDIPSKQQHEAHGIALTNFRVATDVDGHQTSKPAVRIQGTKGEIQLERPARPVRYRIIHKVADGQPAHVEEIECPIPGDGEGMFWEADEAARCVRDGKLESEGMGWEESLAIMRIMDEVRKQNDLVYPQNIETTDYPVKL